MDADEYLNLERVERTHWYYAGKRELVRYWIEKTRSPQGTDRLLDCGAGTGIFAEELNNRCQVMVLDDHEEAIRLLGNRFKQSQILRVSGTSIPLPEENLDFVTALDVLEHIEDDRSAVLEFFRVLKPNGIAVVTVPAGMALWSDWDVALHHHRRYDRTSLVQLFDPLRWEILHINYTNVIAYPAVWFVRKWRAFRAKAKTVDAKARSEDIVPPTWVNAILKATFVLLGRWKRIRFPFGVSLILVARRRSVEELSDLQRQGTN